MADLATGWSEPGWSAWPAPAKLNHFLHIVGRRADGYHLLQTVFQLLDWGDTVHLRPRTDGELRRVDPLPGVAPADDLVMRAAAALRRVTGASGGVDIAITKRIPLGGGLGGGSSDAATTLLALDHLWGTGLDTRELAAIGLELGADVPVFVHGHSAWAEGIGDELTPIELPARWFVVVDPGVTVPTAELFRSPQLTRTAARLTISDFASGQPTENVFQPVVRERFPMVGRALDWLQRHGEARLSGSGGCVFLAVDNATAARAIAAACPDGMRAYTVAGVTHSPLLARVAGSPDSNRFAECASEGP